MYASTFTDPPSKTSPLQLDTPRFFRDDKSLDIPALLLPLEKGANTHTHIHTFTHTHSHTHIYTHTFTYTQKTVTKNVQT